MLPSDDPRTQKQEQKNQDCRNPGSREENRCRYKENGHPRRHIESQLVRGLFKAGLMDNGSPRLVASIEYL